MGKTSERKKQKKSDKQRRKRKQRKQEAAARQRQRALPTNERKLVALASGGEFGPAWILEGWDAPEGLHEDGDGGLRFVFTASSNVGGDQCRECLI